MPSKYQMYAELADQQTRQVTQSMGDWTGFLSTARRLYKYLFEEQLMIHAQRPMRWRLPPSKHGTSP